MCIVQRPWFVNYSVYQSTLRTFEFSPWKSNICHPHLEVISINHRIKKQWQGPLPCNLPALCRGHYATLFFTRPVQRTLCYPVLYLPYAEDIMLPCSLPTLCRGYYATLFFTRPGQRTLCYESFHEIKLEIFNFRMKL